MMKINVSDRAINVVISELYIDIHEKIDAINVK